MMYRIDLAEFSEFPFGRISPEDGEDTGGKFRDTVLKPAIDHLSPGDTIDVNLNNVSVGIGSSFLSESFGGLIKKGYISKEKLLEILTITTEDESYEIEIFKYIESAKEQRNKAPSI